MSDLRENLANKNILFSFIFPFSILGFLKRILNYLGRVYINSTLEFSKNSKFGFYRFFSQIFIRICTYWQLTFNQLPAHKNPLLEPII